MPVRSELKHEVRRDAEAALVVSGDPGGVGTLLAEVVGVVWASVNLLKVRRDRQTRCSIFVLLHRGFGRVADRHDADVVVAARRAGVAGADTGVGREVGEVDRPADGIA
jgi:hypothetical protein